MNIAYPRVETLDGVQDAVERGEPASLDETLRSLTRGRRCVRCGHSYTELRNLARLGCRAYHPGHALLRDDGTSGVPVGAYTCCGRPARAGEPGCVRADHTARANGRMEPTLVLSVQDARVLLPPPTFEALMALADRGDGLVERAGRGVPQLRIARYDARAQRTATAVYSGSQ